MGFVLQPLRSLLFLRLAPPVLLRPCLQDLGGDELGARQDAVHTLVDKVVDGLGLGKAHFHLGGMDVHVRFRGRKGEMQNGKGKAVLHEIGPVTGFQRLRQNIAPQHSPVYEKDFEIAGRSRDVGAPDKAFQLVDAFLRR